MTAQGLEDAECHDRHVKADVAIGLVTKAMRQGLRPQDNQKFREILTTTDWSSFRCGHFSRWWEEKIFSFFDWAAAMPNAETAGAVVATWMAVSLDMLHNAGRYCGNQDKACQKGVTTQCDEWKVRFFEALERAVPVREKLVRVFSSSMESERLPAFHRDCGKRMGSLALTDQKLRAPFLGYACKYSSIFKAEAVGLVDDVLAVINTDPFRYMGFLKAFLPPIPRDSCKADFQRIYDQVRQWVAAEQDANHVAQMRKTQEDFVPYLLGYCRRDRRRGGNDLISITLNAESPGDSLECKVADIAFGEDILGRGIRFTNNECEFFDGKFLNDASIPGTGPVPRKRSEIVARRIKDGKEICIRDPHVTLTWPSGTLTCGALSMRGFRYKEEYNIPGGGGVVFLSTISEHETPNFQKWVAYVTRLDTVDYGKTGRVN